MAILGKVESLGEGKKKNSQVRRARKVGDFMSAVGERKVRSANGSKKPPAPSGCLGISCSIAG